MEALKDMLKTEWIKRDLETVSAHTVDGLAPKAVAFPENLEQVSQVVKTAQNEKWAVLPWGSGSKIGVGNPPSHMDLVISTNRLNKIIDMDTANLTVTVQAGVKFRDLQTSLAGEENRCYLPHEGPSTVSDEAVCSDRDHMGCFIPMMPPFSHSATLGGIIAANSSGPVRLLYGLPRDMVLGVRYVAADGEIVGLGGKTVKNVSGYDMCKLMIGSRGSLGILGEMTLRLLPLPERFGTCLSGFSGLDEASRFLDQIFETRLLPSAVELLNGPLVDEDALEMDSGSYVVAVGLEGFGEAVERMGKEIEEMASASGAQNNVHLPDDPHRIFPGIKGVVDIQLFNVLRHELHQPQGAFFGYRFRIKIRLGLDDRLEQRIGDTVQLGRFLDVVIIPFRGIQTVRISSGFLDIDTIIRFG